jgi:hypothetical protein
VLSWDAKVVKKYHKVAISLEIIWWNGEKVVILQPLLRDKSMKFKLLITF